MRESLVSTIIPVYNRAELVQEAVHSVLAQTYRPIEIIVVDDGSTDATPAVIEYLARSHPEIRLLRRENAGPGRARQTGLETASGEFIQFLDSDDLLASGKLKRQVEALRNDNLAGIAYGKTRFLMRSGEELMPWKDTGQHYSSLFPAMLKHRIWGTSTPLYRKSLFNAAGPFLNLANEEDWEMDCRIAAMGCRLSWVDELVSTERDIADFRASTGGSTDRLLLRDRCIAREHILNHAIGVGIAPGDPYMRCFLDSSFLVARQAALAGLSADSARLIGLLNAFDHNPKRRLFQWLASRLGQQRFTGLAEALRDLKHKASG